jgi:DNA polymerase
MRGAPEKLVRQHARTSALLGVDFVPVFRVSRAPDQTAPDQIAEVKPPGAVAAGAGSAPGAAVAPGATAGRDRARAQALLDEILARYERDAPHQHFVTAHTKIVFGDGDPCARLMFIGEAPGVDEDRIGRPFVGRAGQLLDKMIVAMGLSREQVYIANVLKTRPPNNATPTLEEARLCAPYLFDQIAAVRPEVIVTLGLPATRLLLGTEQSMSSLRGRWAEFSYLGSDLAPPLTVPVMPTYHPAFLLRAYTPENRRKVWSDLQRVMERLGLSRNPEAAKA